MLSDVLSPQDPKVWEPEETNHHPTRSVTEADWLMGTLSRICLAMKDLFTSWLTITKWLPPAFWGFRPFFCQPVRPTNKVKKLASSLLPASCILSPSSNFQSLERQNFLNSFSAFPFHLILLLVFNCWNFFTIVPIHNVTHQEARLCKSGLGIFVQRRHQYMLPQIILHENLR